ncbi:HAMP domain-containing sensor histidine kinase [Clostridium sp. C2-6-12]|uniref:sensor histidine kinase n=1 Tax=Clostridium sp. C2-6-12 TaxID=2698832 RepID=UPI00136FA0E4|nr:HAMP domain-containing sensor histidine kinase [Clostridium sp. C2-6-12]
MNLLAIILIILIIIFLIIFIKLRSYKKQIRDITAQIKDFKDRKTNKKINTQMADKDIENLACEINEYLELYKRNEQEKIAFENTLKQGIANMSHDLRTPLTSIIGYLKLLENDEIDKEEALAVLKNKTNKLNVLINDFFDLASVESEDYELDIKRINLTNILQEEILALYESFESRGFEPMINIIDKPIFIMGDKDSLERIVDNLLSNALKYAEGDIKINLEEVSGKVVLSISNSCTTLAKEDVEHIFDRFYMADQVRKGKGVGLGLSIVKSLVEKMNGNITAKLEDDELYIISQWEVI